MQNGNTPETEREVSEAQAGYPSKDTPYEFHGTDPVSDDELSRQETYRSHAIRAQSRSVTSAESDHGYDSFENSNNKKKRKIPTSSSSGILPPSLAGISADMASMGISVGNDGAEGEDGGTQQYYGQGYPAVPASGTGISGAGRGRYGRSGRHDSRSPLSASANASNWNAGRMSAARHVNGKSSGKKEHSLSDLEGPLLIFSLQPNLAMKAASSRKQSQTQQTPRCHLIKGKKTSASWSNNSEQRRRITLPRSSPSTWEQKI